MRLLLGFWAGDSTVKYEQMNETEKMEYLVKARKVKAREHFQRDFTVVYLAEIRGICFALKLNGTEPTTPEGAIEAGQKFLEILNRKLALAQNSK